MALQFVRAYHMLYNGSILFRSAAAARAKPLEAHHIRGRPRGVDDE